MTLMGSVGNTEMMGPSGRKLVQWEHAFNGGIGTLPVSFPASSEMSSFSTAHSPMIYCLATGLKATESTSNRLKLLKLQVK
jgi:hypothetical protein